MAGVARTGLARDRADLPALETDTEIARDRTLLSGMADKNPSLEGMKLSRFDKILGLTRERINRVYRGHV